MKPTVLITNDDGIHAPGIRALWNSLKESCDVIVIAPSKEQSAVGLSITLREPLRVEKHLWDDTMVLAVTGTPADSVKMALSVLLNKKPDLIVSGINRGSNAGKNVLYSGTVSAVIEGALRGIPGIAFSCSDYIAPDYSLTTHYINALVRYVLNHPLPEETLLNVNFPQKSFAPYKGLKLCRQGQGYWKENPSERAHPAEGHTYYWLGAEHADFDEIKESDVALLNEGWVSAVPVYVGELTHLRHFNETRDHFDNHFEKVCSKAPDILQPEAVG